MMSYNTGVLRQRLKRYTLNTRLVGSESKKGVSYVQRGVKREDGGMTGDVAASPGGLQYKLERFPLVCRHVELAQHVLHAR